MMGVNNLSSGLGKGKTMAKFGEGTAFGSTDFGEEDAYLRDLASGAFDKDVILDITDDCMTAGLDEYGNAPGWTEQQTGMHTRNGCRVDQVTVPGSGGRHTNAERGQWLLSGTVIVY